MAKEDLGVWLVNRGELEESRLEDILQHQVIYGGTLDTNILEMSLLPEDKMLTLVGQYHALPVATKTHLMAAEPDKLRIFPQKLALKYQAVPFKLEGRNLSLAVNSLPDLGTLDDIGFMLSVYIRPFAALEFRVHQALLRMYGVPLPARTENLLAQLGEDADEDRAEWERRLAAKEATATRAKTAPTQEAWVAHEPGKRKAVPAAAPDGTLPPPLPDDAFTPSAEQMPAVAAVVDGLDADLAPQALGGVLHQAMTLPPGDADTASGDLTSELPPLTAGDVMAVTAADPPSKPPPPLPQDGEAPPSDEDSAEARSGADAPHQEANGEDIRPPEAVTALPDFPEEEVPAPPPVDPVFEDPDQVARLQSRAERVTWQLPDARAELALALSREDVVDVLLRFAYKGLEYSAVFVFQNNQFNGWDSIGALEVPRALSRLRISPAPGTSLHLVEETGSHYLGPLKPQDPLPGALGRKPPKAALLIPFAVKGRIVGVLYGDRGSRPISPRHAADLQALVPDVGRMLEALILRQKRERLGFVDQRQRPASTVKEALAAEEENAALAPPDGAEASEAAAESSQPAAKSSQPAPPGPPPLPDRPTAPASAPVREVLPEEADVELPKVDADGPAALPPTLGGPVDPSVFTEPTQEITVHAAVDQDGPTAPPPPQDPRQEYVASPADWDSWSPAARPPPAPPAAVAPPAEDDVPVTLDSPALPRTRPPPLPSKRRTTKIQMPPPMGPNTTERPLDDEALHEREAEECLKEAERARASRLEVLARLMLSLPSHQHTSTTLERAMGRTPQAPAALEVLAAHKGLATAEVLRLWPGPVHVNVFSDDGGNPDLRDVAPLSRVALRLGWAAAGLCAAYGAKSSARETRYLAVLLAREVQHASMSEVVAGRIFDDEPRISYLAAATLDRMLTSKDERSVSARGALAILRQALEEGPEERQRAAVRAASQVHDVSLVPALVEIVDGKNREHAEAAVMALHEITRQDFGSSARKWRSWYKDNGQRRRTEWLIDALGHKEKDNRQAAERELNALTGEYLGYYHDAPKAERDAAVTRWRGWWDQNRGRTDLP